MIANRTALPIPPSDKPLRLDGLHRLSPESRYRRFFSPVHELGANQLRYLTEVDHDAHEALIALDPKKGTVVGVARYIRSKADPATSEVAIAVVGEWQGRGLGRREQRSSLQDKLDGSPDLVDYFYN